MRIVTMGLAACTLWACTGDASHDPAQTAAPQALVEDADCGKTLVLDGEPELAFPGVLTTAYAEVKLAVSPDGQRMLWGASDLPGSIGGDDIWEVVRQGDGWSPPHPVSFDTPQDEFDPSFAPDGSGLYFFSSRPGGFGGDDIYFVPLHRGVYGQPVNLGAGINSAGDEWGPVVSPDGQRLVFASDGRGGKGEHDLFMAERVHGSWAPAENLGDDINSELEDFDATFLDDGRTLVFASERRGDGSVDLYVSVPVHGHYPMPTWLGSDLNSSDFANFATSINLREPGVLYFNSRRPPDLTGGSHVYRVRYHFAG